MRKTDKHIKSDEKKRTKPDLSVESVLKNKKYFAILKLILWSDCHNKKIQTCNMIYALVKDHGKIDANDVRTKNRYEKFYSGNILKEVITPNNLHNSESTFRNYLSNLGEKKLGLIKLVHVKNVKKRCDYYQTTDKFKAIIAKKMLHRAVEKLPEEPGIYTLIIKKIFEALTELEEMKSDMKEANAEDIDNAELLEILLLMKDLTEHTETTFQYDEIVNLLKNLHESQ